MVCIQGSTENQYSLLSGSPGKILQLQLQCELCLVAAYLWLSISQLFTLCNVYLTKLP